MLKKAKEGVDSLWRATCVLLPLQTIKSFFLSAYIRLVFISVLGGPVWLHLWVTADMTGYKEVIKFWLDSVVRQLWPTSYHKVSRSIKTRRPATSLFSPRHSLDICVECHNVENSKNKWNGIWDIRWPFGHHNVYNAVNPKRHRHVHVNERLCSKYHLCREICKRIIS